MNDQERRKELAHFLRTRREQLTPEEVGLPVGARRRTPGLRREELAVLSGIGVTWYTRLEQGREITVSTQVLESLVQVLHLNAAERTHLYALAREELPADAHPLTGILPPSLQTILDTMGIYPAYVTNPRWDILAWNQAMSRVYADFDSMSTHNLNILRFAFTNPHQRKLLVNWEKEAQGVLALFRSSTERYVGEDWFKALVTDLQATSPEFRAWWPRHDIRSIHTGNKELQHPLVGRLDLQSTSFQVIDAPDLRMVVYTPCRNPTPPAS
ncbi:helix-turn-helix transcriptional regulator [Ktedonospora formicarum]|uniref:Transcriptional regulator n=1 Tax=Ktedonospora formicarum TaxID=2778364 RepID=A0A8J3I556_9CHLR|nr:helix-turn-helix transcriptional regulator [Ktedonospora formicarum]GHO46342.1 transcriptional regulator [Ktedonospora formicarum]